MSKFKMPSKFRKQQMWLVTNPWSGESCTLTDEAKNMYLKIKFLERLYHELAATAKTKEDDKKVYECIDEFDNLRYEFAEKWPREYYKLLD